MCTVSIFYRCVLSKQHQWLLSEKCTKLFLTNVIAFIRQAGLHAPSNIMRQYLKYDRKDPLIFCDHYIVLYKLQCHVGHSFNEYKSVIFASKDIIVKGV